MTGSVLSSCFAGAVLLEQTGMAGHHMSVSANLQGCAFPVPGDGVLLNTCMLGNSRVQTIVRIPG